MTLTMHISFLGCLLYESAEILQHAATVAAVVQPRWLLPIPAAIAKLLPGHKRALRKTFFPVDIQISPLHLLLLNLPFVFHIDWDGLYPVPGRCKHWDRICRSVLVYENSCRIQALDMDDVGNRVLWVHLEVGSLLLHVEVDGQLGWCMLW